MSIGGRDGGIPPPSGRRRAAAGRRGGVVLLAALSFPAACDETPGPGPEPEEPAPVADGISRELARDRRERLADIRYDLVLRLPAEAASPVTGRARVDFTLSGAGESLFLDFAGPPEGLTSLRAGGRPLEPEVVNGHLLLPAEALREGENAVEVEFVAGDGPLNRNEEFLYTLFVPDRAHEAFPCFDQPDLKARFRLTLEVPEGWQAVANGEVEEVATGEPGPGGEPAAIWRFAETPLLPTYLFSFAAGKFEVEEEERAGRRMRMLHRETDREKVARNREAVFDLHGRALEWLEEYTGIPYPFGKFDFVLVPSFQYSGMEHPGAILYRAERLLLDESATVNEELARASVIAHETAHMWFGDLVTMRWFDDVWMKEVFANFLAAKIVHPSFPEIDHDLRFLLAHHPAAYAVDRTAGANPIRQELENLSEAGSLYGAIIYQKAPIVMRQLELLVGEEAMREGLREYLEGHRFGNASWPELIAVLDARHADDLREWSRVWVEEAGRPWISVEGTPAARTLTQRDPRERGLVWNQRLEVLLSRPDTSLRVPLRLDRAEVRVPEVRVPVAGGEAGPVFVLADGGGLGYGYFRLEDATRAFLLDSLPAVVEAVPRAVAWLSLWDEMLEGRVAPERLAEVAVREVGEEREAILLEQVLEDFRTLYWRFLDANGRGRVAAGLEELLWRRMHEAEKPGLKAAYLRAFESMAVTGTAVDRLRRLWSGDLRVAGLPLSERDLTRMALELAVRGAPGWRGILERQSGRIENPDRRERFRFVRPALSADRAARDSVFRSLEDPVNRRREPWVLEAVSYLHHPLRAEAALTYIRPSLDMLEEIQRTGDIFFPKRWLDATLGGHSSPEAAAIVRRFLEERPDLPRRLREKVLQSADPLFRAAGLGGVRGRKAAAGS